MYIYISHFILCMQLASVVLYCWRVSFLFSFLFCSICFSFVLFLILLSTQLCFMVPHQVVAMLLCVCGLCVKKTCMQSPSRRPRSCHFRQVQKRFMYRIYQGEMISECSHSFCFLYLKFFTFLLFLYRCLFVSIDDEFSCLPLPLISFFEILSLYCML